VLAGCVASSPPGDAVITGSVLGASCDEATDEECTAMSLSGVEVRVTDRDGRLVGEAVTLSDGSFSVDVPPGTYRVSAASGPVGVGLPDEATVSVDAAQSVEVTLTIDTGVRPMGGAGGGHGCAQPRCRHPGHR
jgi:hypothetical protein